MKKKLVIALRTFLYVVFSLALYAQEKDPTVYITKTGSKYHKEGCRYLSKSMIPIKLSAAAERYSPCSVCNPPAVQNKNIQNKDMSKPTIKEQKREEGYSGQCQAITKKGTQCKRKAMSGSKYCWQHNR